MKNYQRALLMIFTAVILFSMNGCEDKDAAPKNYPAEVSSFVKKVKEDPMIVDHITLGDSWRLVREKGSYFDGDVTKEFDYDILDESENGTYKEYWVFDRDQVMLAFSGERFEKNWDDYYEIFEQESDIPNKRLTIHYVYDGGDKTYTRNWVITSLTAKELILTDENPDEEYFYQYTFRREEL